MFPSFVQLLWEGFCCCCCLLSSWVARVSHFRSICSPLNHCSLGCFVIRSTLPNTPHFFFFHPPQAPFKLSKRRQHNDIESLKRWAKNIIFLFQIHFFILGMCSYVGVGVCAGEGGCQNYHFHGTTVTGGVELPKLSSGLLQEKQYSWSPAHFFRSYTSFSCLLYRTLSNAHGELWDLEDYGVLWHGVSS